MKTSILNLIFLLAISLTASASNNDPKNAVMVLENINVSVSLSNADQTNIFTTVSYDADQSNIEFATKQAISYVQIFNVDGTLEFQLMVDSKKVKLSKSLFDNIGNYKVGFLIGGQDNIQFADIVIK